MSPEFIEFAERSMNFVRVFERVDHYFDKENEEGVYKYVCKYDPNGKHLTIEPHYIRVKKREGKSITDKKRIFQILGKRWKRRETRYYVGHYDSKKYKEKMIEYRQGKIKSRPNGRTWCLIGRDVMWKDYGSSKSLYEENAIVSTLEY